MLYFKQLFETKTFKKVDDSLSEQVTNINPNTFLTLLYLILLAGFLYCVGYGIVKLVKLWKSPNKDLIKSYKQNLESTSADSEQKSIILTLINQVNGEIKDMIYHLNTNDSTNLSAHGCKVIDLIVEQIPLSLKSTKNINHRCAVFVKDAEDQGKLKIFEGCGYSIKGKDKLRLDIKESIAGKVFSNGEYKYIADVTKNKDFTPHPKATKNYYSLLCYPVKVNGEIVGVLSIDGSEKDCFSKDDIAYFKMFSNQIGILFGLMTINTIEKGGVKHGEVQITG